MENATKALIIAGAILISILIISLGIMVYNQASSTVDEASLASETLQAYNQEFINYTGSDVSAATVNALITAVNSNNMTNSNQISITYSATVATTGANTATNTGGINQYNFTVPSTQNYTVTYTLGTDGMIETMTIAN